MNKSRLMDILIFVEINVIQQSIGKKYPYAEMVRPYAYVTSYFTFHIGT